MDTLRIRPIRRSDWMHLERLFGDNGACGGCWCMTWRLPRGGKLYEQNKGEPNRRQFRELVECGNVHGLLAFDGRQPVGWCAVGPVDEFPKVNNSRAYKTSSAHDAWALLCLFVRREHRGRAIGSQLVEAAVPYARDAGASLLDGFPASRPHGKRLADAFAWTGLRSMYVKAGFREVRRKGKLRPYFRVSFGDG